jgi:hypothetical protein
MDFKDHWDLQTAMEVIQNKTVDSKLWAEAIEWLLLYGPPEIVSVLLQASGQATEECYPNLQTAGFSDDGIPRYNISQLAKNLGISEEGIRKILKRKEGSTSDAHFHDNGGSTTVH